MDIVEEIKKCETDEELRELSQEAIEVFTEKAQEENLCTEYLGDDIGIYPKLIVGEEAYNANNVWNGYIPKGVKVNYARYKAEGQDQYTNLGYYYYMDDDDYVFDFFKLIHDEEDIEDDNDIIMVVQSFIEEKFSKCVNPTSRQVMHMLFHKADNTVCPPAHEHKFSDFYHNGSAMCTEIAILAQNLLSLLGLEVIYINDFAHSYNIYVPREEFDRTHKAYVLDFGNYVPCYDLKMDFLCKIPFYGAISDFDKRAEEIFNGRQRVQFPNYVIVKTKYKTFAKKDGEDRDYGVDYTPYEEKKIITDEHADIGGEIILPGDKPTGKKLILDWNEH